MDKQEVETLIRHTEARISAALANLIANLPVQSVDITLHASTAGMGKPVDQIAVGVQVHL